LFDFPISGIISTRSRCIFFLYLWFLFRRGRRRKRRITCSGHNYFYSILFSLSSSLSASLSLSVSSYLTSLSSSLSLSLSLSLFLSLSLSLFLFICERSCAKYIIYFSVAIGEENFLSLASCYVRIFEKGLLFFLLNPESMSG
jgi:hypothetical protein